MIKVSGHLIIKEHLNLYKMIIPAAIESVAGFVDEYIVVDNGCTEDIRNTLESSLKQTNKPYKIISDSSKDFASIRNISLSNTSIDSDFVMHFDADEVYDPIVLNDLKMALDDLKINNITLPGWCVTHHIWLVLEPTIWKREFERKTTIYKYNANLRFTKPVHEYLVGQENTIYPQLPVPNYFHLGYLEPQHEKCLSWFHYELLDPDRGNLNAYREIYDQNMNDGKGGIRDHFVDWLTPATILEANRGHHSCITIDPEEFPEPLKKHVIQPWKESGLLWQDWLRKIDPASYAFYDEWKREHGKWGSWKKTFGWLLKRMQEKHGWPEEKF